MKQSLFTLCLFILFSLIIQAQDIEFQKYHFEKEGFILPYRILYPENFNTDQKYPLIVFLHGAGERGTDNEKQLMHGSEFFIHHNQTGIDPAVVIFPQCPEEFYWAAVKFEFHDDGNRSFIFTPDKDPTPPLETVMGLIDSLSKTSWSDNERFYLGGLSMGGMGTFELLFRMPNTFAAAFPICGGGNESVIAPALAKVPMWIFHGEADAVVPAAYSLNMVDALKKAGGMPKLTIYPGVGHNAWDEVFKEPELLKWLFSNKLSLD